MRWVDATVVATGAGADSPVESGRPGMSCLGDAMIRLQPRDPPSVSPYRVSRPSGPRNALSRNPTPAGPDPRTQAWDDQELGIRCRSGGQGKRERWSVLQDREATQRGGGEHEATVTSKPQQRERKTEGKEKREMWEKRVCITKR